MAKKEFTDVTIEICERKLHFKRVTNETLTKFSEKAEKAYRIVVGEYNVDAFVQRLNGLVEYLINEKKL